MILNLPSGKVLLVYELEPDSADWPYPVADLPDALVRDIDGQVADATRSITHAVVEGGAEAAVAAEVEEPLRLIAAGWVYDPDMEPLRLNVRNSLRAHPDHELAYVVRAATGWLLIKTGTVAGRPRDERELAVRYPRYEVRVVPVEAWS